jgi:hypothetical protein
MTKGDYIHVIFFTVLSTVLSAWYTFTAPPESDPIANLGVCLAIGVGIAIIQFFIYDVWKRRLRKKK